MHDPLKPFIGATIHYVLGPEDAQKAALAHGQGDRIPEAMMRSGQHLPAMVTKVWNALPGHIANVNATCFLDGSKDLLPVFGVAYDGGESGRTQFGTWHWPEPVQ